MMRRPSWGQWPGMGLKRVTLVALCVTGVLGLTYLLLEFYPQPFFPHSVEAEGIRLYSTAPIPESAKGRLVDVKWKLSRSRLYDPTHELTLFLCNDELTYAFFSCGGRGAARANALTQRTFIGAADFSRCAVWEPSRTDRVSSLSDVVSRSLVYVLMARRFGPQIYFSVPRWVKVGYGEAIVQRSSSQEERADSVLKAGRSDPGSVFESIKYRRMVEYQILGEGLKIEQLVHDPPSEDEVEKGMRDWLRRGRTAATSAPPETVVGSTLLDTWLTPRSVFGETAWVGSSTRRSPKSVTLRGTVIRKQWSMSYESYNARGGEYYVLDVGDPAEVERAAGEALETTATPGWRTAAEGVVLKQSPEVLFGEFSGFLGKRVEVHGVYLPGERWKPPTDYPGTYILPSKDPRTGEVLWPIVGAGFRVDGMRVLQDGAE
jgi:hypothetical protein